MLVELSRSERDLEFKTAHGHRLLSRKLKKIANRTHGLSAKLGPIQITGRENGVIDKKYPLVSIETGADSQGVMVARPAVGSDLSGVERGSESVSPILHVSDSLLLPIGGNEAASHRMV